ncbi:hypothetical protein IOD16_26140 [Saccharothrix sp. 6-C]|uniref:hypothetical protein n=1 Tax=Saccharothrix sp. 6-C TaxID=2781735 RepID=UPI001916FD3D|nr:hypothetical protein [Saccharothrix sp. 6-C]QQQ74617.1 hypothetical protein IOD16_26140 [Saccharothrix sp. 6-C]
MLATPGDTPDVAVPPGTAGVALDFALAPARGAVRGPDAWDCPSLTQAACREAGVAFP